MDSNSAPSYTPIDPIPAPQEPQKKSSKVWIIVLVVVLLLCCFCLVAVGVYLWFNGDQIFNDYMIINPLLFLGA